MPHSFACLTCGLFWSRFDCMQPAYCRFPLCVLKSGLVHRRPADPPPRNAHTRRSPVLPCPTSSSNQRNSPKAMSGVQQQYGARLSLVPPVLTGIAGGRLQGGMLNDAATVRSPTAAPTAWLPQRAPISAPSTSASWSSRPPRRSLTPSPQPASSSRGPGGQAADGAPESSGWAHLVDAGITLGSTTRTAWAPSSVMAHTSEPPLSPFPALHRPLCLWSLSISCTMFAHPCEPPLSSLPFPRPVLLSLSPVTCHVL